MTRPNITFVNDLLQTIGARVRRRTPPAVSDVPPLRRLDEACERLMRRSGEASRIAVAEQALDAYAQLDDRGAHRGRILPGPLPVFG